MNFGILKENFDKIYYAKAFDKCVLAFFFSEFHRFNAL